jgi:hypothetical protein
MDDNPDPCLSLPIGEIGLGRHSHHLVYCQSTNRTDRDSLKEDDEMCGHAVRPGSERSEPATRIVQTCR